MEKKTQQIVIIAGIAIAGYYFWKRYWSTNMCVRDADVKKIDHIMDKISFNQLNRSVS